MDQKIKDVLAGGFSKEELDKIVAFLEKGFSPNGQTVIASVFLYARDNSKSVDEVLVACQKEWERNWNYQHPDIKGDPDAPGGAGMQNRASLENVYKDLQVPSPLVAKKDVKIPNGALVVKTRNSTYRLSAADEKGERTVTRDEAPLGRSRCKIAVLAVGQRMELDWVDTNSYLDSSTVRSIEEV